jgi:DNA repair protein RecO (recombination protein O)
MLHKTKGIVLSFVKYGDSSIILKCYTHQFGLQSYIVNSVRSTKQKSKIAFFQTLTLLDLVVYYQKNVQKIFRISEVQCPYVFQTIPYQYTKTTIALFLTEILNKALQEEQPDEQLFEFIWQSVIYFDKMNVGIENFHLTFLLKLTVYLGFGTTEGSLFMDQLSNYRSFKGGNSEQKELEELISHLSTRNYDEQAVTINNWQRRQILELILDFYHIHLTNFDQLKSLTVLRTLIL